MHLRVVEDVGRDVSRRALSGSVGTERGGEGGDALMLDGASEEAGCLCVCEGCAQRLRQRYDVRGVAREPGIVVHFGGDGGEHVPRPELVAGRRGALRELLRCYCGDEACVFRHLDIRFCA